MNIVDPKNSNNATHKFNINPAAMLTSLAIKNHKFFSTKCATYPLVTPLYPFNLLCLYYSERGRFSGKWMRMRIKRIFFISQIYRIASGDGLRKMKLWIERMKQKKFCALQFLRNIDWDNENNKDENKILFFGAENIEIKIFEIYFMFFIKK